MPSTNLFDIKTVFGDLKRHELVELAKIAEQAERYEDMCQVMEELVGAAKTSGEGLTVDERNLLSVAFKNVVGARRASLRSLNTDKKAPGADIYSSQLQAELKAMCTNILQILDDGLIDSNKADDAQVFYLKMGADYYRYLAECVEDNKTYPVKAKEYYQKAMDIAEKQLPPTHPIRLGLALNYSVCLYEIINEKDNACQLAKTAFDEAISQLDKLEETDYKDSTLIMQLLRDNLTLWTSAEDDDEN